MLLPMTSSIVWLASMPETAALSERIMGRSYFRVGADQVVGEVGSGVPAVIVVTPLSGASLSPIWSSGPVVPTLTPVTRPDTLVPSVAMAVTFLPIIDDVAIVPSAAADAVSWVWIAWSAWTVYICAVWVIISVPVVGLVGSWYFSWATRRLRNVWELSGGAALAAGVDVLAAAPVVSVTPEMAAGIGFSSS
jgi:hypothetical protein